MNHICLRNEAQCDCEIHDQMCHTVNVVTPAIMCPTVSALPVVLIALVFLLPQEGVLEARLLLRQSAIGTDRDHNRYWMFTSTPPGLYVEKGKPIHLDDKSTSKMSRSSWFRFLAIH